MTPPPEFDFQHDFKSINLARFQPSKTPGGTGTSDLDYVQTVNRELFRNRIVFNDGGTPAIKQDVFSKRPSPGIVGRLFLATDTYELFRDLGNTWVNVTEQMSASGQFLPDSPVTPGTYDRVMVNAKGQVINGWNNDFVRERFKYQSSGATVHHVIAHGLNTLHTEISVLVHNSDNTWSNDIVRINVIDVNNLEVWLTEASNIIANIIKLD